MDTNSHDIFFVVCIIVGNFFVINLMVAVQFTYLRQSLEEGSNKKKELAKLTAPPAPNPDPQAKEQAKPDNPGQLKEEEKNKNEQNDINEEPEWNGDISPAVGIGRKLEDNDASKENFASAGGAAVGDGEGDGAPDGAALGVPVEFED